MSLSGQATIESQLGHYEGEVEELKGKLGEVQVERKAEIAEVEEFRAHVKQTFDTVEAEAARMEGNTTRAAQRAMSIISRSYGLVNQALTMMGMGISGMAGATITFIISTATTLLTLATSKLTAQDYFGAAAGFAGASMAFAQQTIAEIERQRIEREQQEAISFVAPSKIHSTQITVML